MTRAAQWVIEQSESQFQQAVQELATLEGWGWMHVRGRQMVSGYYRTPTDGPLGPGWPDLSLVRDGRLLFAELKAQKGILSKRQKEVLAVLRAIPCAEVYVWRPSDWSVILEVLSK